VSPSGDVVVFDACDSSGAECDVYQAVRSGGAWTTTPVAATDAYEAGPDTDGTIVVYASELMSAGMIADIYYRPVSGEAATQLELPGAQYLPRISKGVVSFVSRGPTLLETSDIFVYAIATNTLFQLTDTPAVNEEFHDVGRPARRRRPGGLGGRHGDGSFQNIYARTFRLPNAGYSFGGFFGPVDNPPVFNGVVAGRAIPVKFSLGGDQGLAIFEAGYPTSQQIACDRASPLDGIEKTVPARGPSLSYDAATDQYTYAWKTEKSWKGTCRQLVLGSWMAATTAPTSC